ncbi:MAG: dicarboxylate/amino acid:cation symporter [Bacteroidales bacterium]|nr:dicarboxylate/amino acid:cation symporter [Bacteroidales bacterium]
MKRLGLFPRVVIAIALGALLGMFMPEFMLRVLKTFNVLFAQCLKFVVPLLVLGLVTPAIANLGRGAGKMLAAVVGISYISTVCAGFFAFECSTHLFPHYLFAGDAQAAGEAAEAAVEPFFALKIPPVCDILTSLLLSFMLGIGIIFTKADVIKQGFDQFGEIIKLTIERAVIPLLPVYIFTMICEMSAGGKLALIMGTGLKVIVTGIGISIAFLFLQYVITGIVARRNPFRLMWNMVPAYLTGFSVCSSSVCIPVTLAGTLRNGATPEIANFTVPLCSTVHMCGSTIKLATTAVAVMYICGIEPDFTLFANFVFLQAISSVAAPGVMGGVLMASVGLLESVLGFSPEHSALLMTIYLALDGYGPACNVSGDAAVTLIIDSIFRRKKGVESQLAVEV